VALLLPPPQRTLLCRKLQHPDVRGGAQALIDGLELHGVLHLGRGQALKEGGPEHGLVALLQLGAAQVRHRVAAEAGRDGARAATAHAAHERA
jgi:hypothetical protein